MSAETKESRSRLVPLAAALTAMATMIGAALSIPGLKETLGSLVGSQTPAISASPAALVSGVPGAANGMLAGGGAAAPPQRGAAAAAARPAAGGSAGQGQGQGQGQDIVKPEPLPAADHAAHDPAPDEPAAADPAADAGGE